MSAAVNVRDRRVIVTGASQGLGFAVASGLLKGGAHVAICGRDPAVLELAHQELRPLVSKGQKLVVEPADVSSETEVQRFVTAALEGLGGVDVLVNNAGIYGPMGAIEETDWMAWMQAVQINLFGSILMCRALLPAMKAQKSGKIIQLSGGGATAPMPRMSAYAASKAAIVRFCESLALEVEDFGIEVNSIAAGALNTRLLEQVLEAGPERVGDDFYSRSLKQKENGGAPIERAVEMVMFLSSRSSDGITGKLMSALWDRWEDFPAHREELASSDVYTLRRITGRDRNLPWGDV